MCVQLFFFKQKTAYEMRISDWSSDVCSSDLRAAPRRSPRRASADLLLEARIERAELRQAHLGRVGAAADPALLELALGDEALIVVEQRIEIGSASCRERVGQYV